MVLMAQELPHGGLIDIAKLIVELGTCKSMVEARRLITQGAVEIDGEKVGRYKELTEDFILQVGKRFFRKVKMPRIKVTAEVEGNEAEILDIEEVRDGPL